MDGTVYSGAAVHRGGTTPSPTASGSFTLDNLVSISGYSSVFARSLLLALIATVICLVIALSRWATSSPACGCNKQHIMLMLVMLPMWMNFLLRTYAWMGLLERQRPREPLLLGAVRPRDPGYHAEHLRRGGAGHGVQLSALYDPAALHQS